MAEAWQGGRSAGTEYKLPSSEGKQGWGRVLERDWGQAPLLSNVGELACVPLKGTATLVGKQALLGFQEGAGG